MDARSPFAERPRHGVLWAEVEFVPKHQAQARAHKRNWSDQNVKTKACCFFGVSQRGPAAGGPNVRALINCLQLTSLA